MVFHAHLSSNFWHKLFKKFTQGHCLSMGTFCDGHLFSVRSCVWCHKPVGTIQKSNRLQQRSATLSLLGLHLNGHLYSNTGTKGISGQMEWFAITVLFNFLKKQTSMYKDYTSTKCTFQKQLNQFNAGILHHAHKNVWPQLLLIHTKGKTDGLWNLPGGRMLPCLGHCSVAPPVCTVGQTLVDSHSLPCDEGLPLCLEIHSKTIL